MPVGTKYHEIVILSTPTLIREHKAIHFSTSLGEAELKQELMKISSSDDGEKTPA